jgi:hypothetical protein
VTERNQSRERRQESERRDGHRAASAVSMARRAVEQVTELLGRDVEGVVSLERNDDGWRVGVEVVELRRVPSTADLLAEYDVELDSRGQLVGYRRVRRYPRGKAQDDQ